MVFPTIESITPTATTPAALNHVIDYPAVVNAGDTFICIFTCDDNEIVTFPNEGVDWTTIYNEDAGPQGPTLAVAWRKAAGTEGSGTFTVTTGTVEESSVYLIRISGAADPAIDAPEATAEATGNSNTPTSIILTPGGGARDYLWIAAEGNDDDDATTAWPANMGDNNLSAIGGTSVNLGMATVDVNAINFTPGTFTIAAGETWECVTIAVYPAPVPGSANLSAFFTVRRDDGQDLLGIFDARQAGSTDLFCFFNVRQSDSADLLGIFNIQQADNAELLGIFSARRDGSEDLFGEFIIQSIQAGSVNLPAEFIIPRDGLAELLSEFISRQTSSVKLFGEFIARHKDDEELLGEFISAQAFADLPAVFHALEYVGSPVLKCTFIVAQWQEELPAETCVHTVRVSQDLNTWTEYDPEEELDHDCNDSWWTDTPRLRENTSLTKDVGAVGLGSDFFHELVLNVYAVGATANGAEERICAWAGSVSLANQNFYDIPGNEIVALIVMATDTADQYQLMLIEKGGNSDTMATIWPNYQDRYIVIYKQDTSIVAASYQDPAHTILEDSAEITLSGDLNLRYVSIPMSYGQLGAEISSGLIDPIFGSMENLSCGFIAQHSDSEELPAEFESGQGSVDLSGMFIAQHDAWKELSGEFIVRSSDGENLFGEFRARCSRRFGGNWQRKMWHVGAYYWRGRYCPTHDRLEFEYIAEEDLALNTWTENVAARIDASGFHAGSIKGDLTVRGAGEGIPTTILYSDGEDVWIAESDETSVLGWAWDNLTKVFDGTPNDWYRKVNLAANRTTPTPRLWACAVFYDDLPDGKRWVKASRQSIGGDITGWDAEVPISNINNTSTIYGCSVRSMGDSGVAKNDMIFVYKENIAIRSRYYDGDWDDPPEDIDTTTIGGRAVWDLEHVETLAGDEMAHIVYVDADNSVQWKERDPGPAQVWSAASELHAPIHPHYGVGIVEHGGGWSWVIWVNNVEVEHRLHICDPETWWPLLANPPAVFDPSTDAVITTSTIEQPQTPDSIHAGDAVPICWVGQTAPGTPCGLGWGILRKAAEYGLSCEFIVRHSASRDLKVGFDGQVSLNLPTEFIARQSDFEELSAKFEVGQDWENLSAKFIVRHSASLELHSSFKSQDKENLPAEFLTLRTTQQILPAQFVVSQDSENLPGEFILRLSGSQPLLGAFDIVHAINLGAEFEIRHIDSAELLGIMASRKSDFQELSAGFSITNTNISDLLGGFTIRHAFTGTGIIIARDPKALFNYDVKVGTGFLSKPVIGSDAEHNIVGSASYKFRVKYLLHQYDSLSFGWKYQYPEWEIISQNLPAKAFVLNAGIADLPSKVHIQQPFKDLPAFFVTGDMPPFYDSTWIVNLGIDPWATSIGTEWETIMEFYWPLDMQSSDNILFLWDAQIRAWGPGAEYYVQITFQNDDEEKHILMPSGSNPNSGWMWDGLAAGIFPIAISRPWIVAIGSQWEKPWTVRVEMKSTQAIDVFWQSLNMIMHTRRDWP